MPFEHYIQKGAKRLRMGYTTGTCAALAAKAAARMLLAGSPERTVGLLTPKGIFVQADVLEAEIGGDFASCAVRKDAGDDPDVTDGVLVYARVSRASRPGVFIDGGAGVGRVTRPGLDQPVGAAAINSVPRKMIAEAVASVCAEFGYEGGMDVVISVPGGERLAARTMNPKLGIEGGISILGTSGVVEPMSERALVDTIGLELKMLASWGCSRAVITPGNYGESFLRSHPLFCSMPSVKASNYIGDALDLAVAAGFREILVVGHIGKIVKLAGGIMNTHSSVADCRLEILAAHAALRGADRSLIEGVFSAATTEAALELIEERGMKEAVLGSLLEKVQEHLDRRVGAAADAGAVVFSNVSGLLGMTEKAGKLIESFEREAQ